MTLHLPLKVLQKSERLRPDCFSGEVSKESRVPLFLSLLPSFRLRFHRGLEIDSCCVRVKSMFSAKLISPSGNYKSHPQVLEHSPSDCILSLKRLQKFQTGKIIGKQLVMCSSQNSQKFCRFYDIIAKNITHFTHLLYRICGTRMFTFLLSSIRLNEK